MANSTATKKVFISHASEDHALAMAVCEGLETAGIGCWIAPRDIPGGKHWGAEIVQVIQSSSVLLLLFSENANASTNVQSEVMLAHRHHRIVFPVRLEDAQPTGNIDYVVNTTQWLDLFPSPKSCIPHVISSIQSLITSGRTVVVSSLRDRKKGSSLPSWPKNLLLLIGGFVACYTWMQIASKSDEKPEAVSPEIRSPATPASPAPSPTFASGKVAAAPSATKSTDVSSPVAPVTEPAIHQPTQIPVSSPRPAEPAPLSSEKMPQAKKPLIIPPHEDKGISYTLKKCERQDNQVTCWFSVLSPNEDRLIQFGLNSVMLGENDQSWQKPLLVQDDKELALEYAVVTLSSGVPNRLGFRFQGVPSEVQIVKKLRINLSPSTSLTPITVEDIPIER